MRIRAKVAYDGTDFFGFQRQADARTIQGEIETALERVFGERMTVTAAGRTDAGVHAIGQVIAFEVDWRHALDALTRSLNANLSDDVAVRELQVCDTDFHPRYAAVSRTYEYTAYSCDVRQPLWRRYAWQLEQAPNLALMNEAAQYLVGAHDFAAFGSAPSGREEETTVREVMRAEWRSAGDRLQFTIEANAFLFRMVRRIVTALVKVGQGRHHPDDVKEMLESKDAQRITGLAPASGLCLVAVKYRVQ
jgi:tRNA pseudouridine38-40 synthase